MPASSSCSITSAWAKGSSSASCAEIAELVTSSDGRSAVCRVADADESSSDGRDQSFCSAENCEAKLVASIAVVVAVANSSRNDGAFALPRYTASAYPSAMLRIAVTIRNGITVERSHGANPHKFSRAAPADKAWWERRRQRIAGQPPQSRVV